MKILIVDTETTGLDSDAQVCELAATLYKISDTNRGAIASASVLLPFFGQNNAETINGINSKLVSESESVFAEMVNAICHLVSQADCVVAFGIEFDKPHWKSIVGQLPWICAKTEFLWDYPKDNFALYALALWLGIGVSSVHRAGDDVRLLVECFNRVDKLEERFDRAIERSKSPWVEFRAVVFYDQKELVKQAGFVWDAPRKIWVKKVKACDRENFLDTLHFTGLDFPVEVLDAAV